MKDATSLLRVRPCSWLLLAVLVASFAPTGSSAQAAPDTDVNQSAPTQLSPYLVQTTATGYGAQYSNSSSRLNLKYIDVPQTVNVVSSEFLADAALFDSREFVKYVNNIVVRTNSHQVETFFVRGLQTSNSYVDGFLVGFPTNRDSGLIDRVEYVKGPASAAMGRGEAAGLVNFVTKSPVGKRGNSYSVFYGSDSFYRAQFDHNGVIGSGRAMSYRIPVYFEDGDSPRGGTGGELMHIKKYGIGPSFRWQFTPRTELRLNSGFYHFEGPGSIAATNWSDKDVYRARLATGLVSPWTLGVDPLLDPRIVHGFRGPGRKTDNAEASATVVQKFTDSLSLRAGARWEDMDERFIQQNISLIVARNPADPTDYLVPLTMADNLRHGDALRGQADLLFERPIGSTKHQFLLGYDQFTRSFSTKSGSRGGLTQSMYHPNLSGPPGFATDTWVTAYTTDRREKSEGYAYYGQYSGTFFNGRIGVMAGWREDKTSGKLHDNRTRVSTPIAKAKTHVPRYSVTYKPTSTMTLYYVHSEQADPSVVQSRYTGFATAGGATLWPASDPRLAGEVVVSAVTAELDEVGAKMNLLDDKLTLSAALFSIERHRD